MFWEIVPRDPIVVGDGRPLHAGTGQGIGVIDLPIARERSTNLPYLPGSSLKGVLRDCCPNDIARKIFGAERMEQELYARSLHLTDQRLLLLPVRSLAGTFAWTTSKLVLTRFSRDLKGAGIDRREGCRKLF
ncbi:MAG: type III-B CRISPR module RAMP protein Cmr4 [Acidobacteriota bacterium]|nr:type III-B CRISPR module RAMP protein Cmr4 [Blastocatellia bacterium]MDW8413169.1 type III-B CRISPR module RAMP protein Cmr4 [Acidobacteriota bacterium]